MGNRLRAKHAQIIAELRYLRVPVPLEVVPFFANKNQEQFFFNISHSSGRTETGEVSLGKDCDTELALLLLTPQSNLSPPSCSGCQKRGGSVTCRRFL
jgi:hypothetical protein